MIVAVAASSGSAHACGSVSGRYSASSSPRMNLCVDIERVERVLQGRVGVDDLGAAVPDDVLDLGAAEPEVDRDEHASPPGDAEERREQPRRVLRDDGDPAADRHAEFVEPAACARAFAAICAVGELTQRRRGLVGLVDDGDAVGIDVLGAVEEVADGQRVVHGAPPVPSYPRSAAATLRVSRAASAACLRARLAARFVARFGGLGVGLDRRLRVGAGVLAGDRRLGRARRRCTRLTPDAEHPHVLGDRDALLGRPRAVLLVHAGRAPPHAQQRAAEPGQRRGRRARRGRAGRSSAPPRATSPTARALANGFGGTFSRTG